MELFCIFTAWMLISWLWYCTIVCKILLGESVNVTQDPLCITSYNCMWSHNYFKIKSLILKTSREASISIESTEYFCQRKQVSRSNSIINSCLSLAGIPSTTILENRQNFLKPEVPCLSDEVKNSIYPTRV